MAGAVVRPHPSSSAPVLQGKVDISCENARCQGSVSSCGSAGYKSNGGVVMRSCFFGANERRWEKIRSRASCRRGHTKGFKGNKWLPVRAGLEELLRNQVLVSCTAAAILGQLVKPISSAVRGKGFNWRLIYTSGGMPSVHSATVTAAATSLGMERGLSDSLFGLSVILASLVMYDAQGVRRSVGKQAEVINTIVFTHMAGAMLPPSATPAKPSSNPPFAIGVELARDPVQAELAFMEDAGTSASYESSSKSTAVLSKESSPGVIGTSTAFAGEGPEANGAAQILVEDAENLPSVKGGEVNLQEIGSSNGWRQIPLKESVGHTKVEVFVGAVWGIVIALALHSSIQ